MRNILLRNKSKNNINKLTVTTISKLELYILKLVTYSNYLVSKFLFEEKLGEHFLLTNERTHRHTHRQIDRDVRLTIIY